MAERLKGKVALVTGANHGIGAATARALAVQGAKVAIGYLDKPATGRPDDGVQILHESKGQVAAEALRDEIRHIGSEAFCIAGDLADEVVIPRLFAAAEEALGPVQILVNNAAHCEAPDTLDTISPGTFDRTFSVNARGMLLMAAEFVRRHRARGDTWGRVINLSTDAAQVFAGQITYGASKAAIEAFTRSIAIEVGPLGITVNAVAPGPVQTGYITPDLEERLLPDIPLRRLGRPEDIADVICFLASDGARWLTGQVIKVSGGHAL